MNTLKLLSKHSSQDYYKTAIIRADEFLKVMTGQQTNVRHYIDQAYQTMLPGKVRN